MNVHGVSGNYSGWWLLGAVVGVAAAAGAWWLRPAPVGMASPEKVESKPFVSIQEDDMKTKVTKTDEEWRRQLSADQFRIARQKGTEPAFTGEYWNNHRDGVYHCVCCGQPLFDSTTKFESGTGWPSFWQPLDKEKVGVHEDDSHMMQRTEVICSRCDAHLGHVFNDGPRPTGLRYCMNSGALKFAERSADAKPSEAQPAKP